MNINEKLSLSSTTEKSYAEMSELVRQLRAWLTTSSEKRPETSMSSPPPRSETAATGMTTHKRSTSTPTKGVNMEFLLSIHGTKSINTLTSKEPSSFSMNNVSWEMVSGSIASSESLREIDGFYYPRLLGTPGSTIYPYFLPTDSIVLEPNSSENTWSITIMRGSPRSTDTSESTS